MNNQRNQRRNNHEVESNLRFAVEEEGLKYFIFFDFFDFAVKFQSLFFSLNSLLVGSQHKKCEAYSGGRKSRTYGPPPLAPAKRLAPQVSWASTTPLGGFLMAAKAACLAPATPPPGGLGTAETGGLRSPTPPLKTGYLATSRRNNREVESNLRFAVEEEVKEKGLKYFLLKTDWNAI
jgi:hypothetical protein